MNMFNALDANTSNSAQKQRILRLVNTLSDTSAPYNQFSLPVAHQYQITLVTFYPSEVEVPDSMILYNGDGTVRGFVRMLRSALEHDRHDLIHVHYAHVGVLFLLVNLFRLHLYRSRLVYTVHTSYPNLKLRNRIMTWFVLLFFNKIVFCSYSSQASFPSFIKRLIEGRSEVVQNGVDIARIDRALDDTSSSSDSNPFTLISIGRLIALKQPLLILDSFVQNMSSVDRLVYLGDGNMRPLLLSYIKGLGLNDRVILAGSVSRDDVYRYLKEADVFISASTVEGLPIAVLETMAACCPVILSDIPPHREIAENADYIPLIAANDTEGFCRALRSFARMSQDERSLIGEKCRELVQSQFSLEKMHTGYDRIFKSLQIGDDIDYR